VKKRIENIPIASIRILNPRFRDKNKFAVVVESIRTVGLKKPIKVSKNGDNGKSSTLYDLICGQGRIEAFKALGYDKIPAEVVNVSKEDGLLMSLVENMARRFPKPADLMAEIERLKAKGYSNSAISRKLGMSDSRVGDFLKLKALGEERLLHAALSGTISVGIALDIAKTTTIDSQRELLKAYQDGQLTQNAIRTVRRIMEQRKILGKTRKGNEIAGRKTETTADGMIRTFRTQTQRMKDMSRKKRICEEKLLILTGAFRMLLNDEDFVALLKSEKAEAIPEMLSKRVLATK
jgi:ParB family chromosome partitioning protein